MHLLKHAWYSGSAFVPFSAGSISFAMADCVGRRNVAAHPAPISRRKAPRFDTESGLDRDFETVYEAVLPIAARRTTTRRRGILPKRVMVASLTDVATRPGGRRGARAGSAWVVSFGRPRLLPLDRSAPEPQGNGYCRGTRYRQDITIHAGHGQVGHRRDERP